MALGWKPEGKISSGRPRRRWGDNIGMDFEELCWEVTEWTDRAQGRGKWRVLVNAGITFGFGFHKLCRVSRLAEQRLDFQEVLCYIS